VCGRAYEAKRSTSKYCGSGCRVRKTRQPGDKAKVAALPRVAPALSGLLATTTSELAAAGRLETTIGQQAVALALRIETSFGDTGSSVAALHKELRAVMEQALAGAERAVDPVDELKAWRDRRRAHAG
jgi:hypothetical protein